MKQKLIIPILLLAVSRSVFGVVFPVHILNKKYAVQCLAVDSMREVLFKNEYPKVLLDLKELETWAGDKRDNQLKYIFRLQQYSFIITSEKADSTIEKTLVEYIKEMDEEKLYQLKAEGFELLADYYWHTKKFASALENFIYGYECYSQFTVDEFPHKPEYMYELGGKYYFFRDFKSAKKYFLEVFHNISEDKMSNAISKMNTLALCYSNLEQYDTAAIFFNRAKDIAIKYDNELWIGIISGNLGNNYLKQGKLDEAVPLMNKNIELSRKHHAMDDLAMSLSEFGSILFLKNDYKKDLEMQMEAMEIVKQKNLFVNNRIMSRIYPNVAKALAASGNMTLAYNYLDSAIRTKENVEKERNIVFLSGVQHKIDIEKHKGELLKKEAEIKQQKLLRNSSVLGLAVVLLFAVVFFRQRNKITKEKQRSDDLLLNILPAEVAEELKQTGGAKAKSFDNVSVLFTDFVSFTQISEALSPTELVEEIHHCFTEFDKIIERNGLEKIKTIGDAYLAVCGMPIEHDDHAIKTIEAAIEIRNFMELRKSQIHNSKSKIFAIRIGVNSGPVVAGIVGVKKFAYDIWGDTVNLAARMEQHSMEGKINISGNTYELVKNNFHCIHRGKIEAKNKGEVDMYFVEQPK